MDFVNVVLRLIAIKGISKNKMLTDLGLSKNSIVDWTKRKTIPNGETLSKIAEYFEVSTDYLLGNEDKKINPSPEREEFMRFLETADAKEKELVHNMIKTIISQRSNKN